MAKYEAELRADSTDEWSVYKLIHKKYFGTIIGTERQYHSTFYKKSEEQMREILKNLECPKVVRFEDKCDV